MTLRKLVRGAGCVSFCLTLIGFAGTPTVAGKPGEILSAFQAPGPGPRDLAWDGASLWLLDDLTHMFYQIDPHSGEVQREIDAPSSAVRGFTWAGAEIWTADAASGLLCRLDSSAQTVRHEIAAPRLPGAGEQQELGGLAWDGAHLWCGMIAGWSSRVSQVDPHSGEVKRYFFTKGFPEAVATDGRSLWSATHSAGERLGLIYQYNLDDGRAIAQFDAPGHQPAGLAWDGECLWYVDRATGLVCRLAVE